MPKKLVDNFLYADLTYKIRGAMYKVHQRLGSSYQEKYYQRAIDEFLIFNLKFEMKSK